VGLETRLQRFGQFLDDDDFLYEILNFLCEKLKFQDENLRFSL